MLVRSGSEEEAVPTPGAARVLERGVSGLVGGKRERGREGGRKEGEGERGRGRGRREGGRRGRERVGGRKREV